MNPNSKSLGWKLALTSCLTIGEAGAMIALFGNCSLAQIIPDATLPNNSRVTKQDNTNLIEGGTQAGSNLFHSFEEFSVPTGGIAFFNNALDIQNIISRVTGKSVSNIDGLIRSLGTANLFLINPNGIIFGRNARLDIGGSFVASTASSLKFADDFEFIATTPQTTPLLTVSVPIGLQYGENPGSIINQSQVTNKINPNQRVGLQVQPRKTLALVGGGITLSGGYLTAAGLRSAGGRIELGSVADNGLVTLKSTSKGWRLGYEGVQNFQDIKLSQQAIVDASGNGSGEIQVQGRYVRLTDGSQIQANTLSTRRGGKLAVNASEAVEIFGTSPDGQQRSGLTSETKGDGIAGALTINTKRLIVQNGALISTGASLDNGIRISPKGGAAGNLTIHASESVELTGETGIENNFQSRLTTQTAGNKKTATAGDLTINTGKLVLKDGAQISAGTFPRSAGDGGNLTITADSIEVIGVSKYSSQVSRITNLTAGAGNAKTLTINTRKLSVRNGGQIAASPISRSRDPNNLSTGQGGNLNVNADYIEVIGVSPTNSNLYPSRLSTRTEGAGKAGDLTIKTRTLIVKDGAQVSAGTALNSRGEGGSLTVNASESIEVSGEELFGGQFPSRLTNRTFGKGNVATSKITTRKLIIRDGGQVSSDTFAEGFAGNLEVTASDLIEVNGKTSYDSPSKLSAISNTASPAGDLAIATKHLIIQNGAEVSVSGQGSGNAGNLVVKAEDIKLNNGVLKATTASGDGGNLKLDVADILLMRRGSEISTSAGTAQQPGNGGNITINTPDGFIIAAPNENSDITANAFSGKGGRVTIKVTDIFGITPLSLQDVEKLRSENLDPRQLQTNDITAISLTNPSLSGTIELNTPEIDPNSGLIELPTIPVDTEVAQGCYSPDYAQSKFVITGRGGLPPNPKDILTPDATQIDWVSVKPSHNNRSLPPVSIKPATSTPKRIVEATGATLNAFGQIVLSANSFTLNPHTSRQNATQCHGS